jgi:hypothetical protein
MNDDNGFDWRFMSLRTRILVVVGTVLWFAMALCGLPSHCTGALCVARLWDFCGYAPAG